MSVRSGLRIAVRVVLAALAYLISFVVSYGLVMPAVPPDPSAAASPLSAAGAMLLMAALHTAVMAWLILRSRLSGRQLAVTITSVFFGVQSLLPQVESWIFQAYRSLLSPQSMKMRSTSCGSKDSSSPSMPSASVWSALPFPSLSSASDVLSPRASR